MQCHGLARLRFSINAPINYGRSRSGGSLHSFSLGNDAGCTGTGGRGINSQNRRRQYSSSKLNNETIGNLLAKDEIVISGLSGRFPQTESIEEFKENLLNGKDMLGEQTRFTVGNRLPPRYGFMNNLDKFDADFFGVSAKLARVMDPALRKLLEVAYETIMDAGINPETLRGTKTAVFVGTDGADPNSFWTLKHGREELGGFSEIGTPICLQANQVSHLLDLKGTSLILSTACSSSLFTMDTAVNAILSGKVDRAVVGATCLHLCSHHSDNFDAIGATSPTGDSRPFDKAANGFVRSEAVVAMLIERKSIAKRSYATIKSIRTNCDGAKKEGIFCPSGRSQENLYREVYRDAGVDPGSVFYIETHGTGTPAGDPQELQGISNVFCQVEGRKEPLLIGSVKSNMGHGEAAAGLCGIAKVLIAAQQGLIPPNLHFQEPHERAAHLFDGSLKVVTEKTPFTGKYVGVSSFGIGGTNGHLVLEPNRNHLNKNNDTDLLPRLVPFSGQTEGDVKESLEAACAGAKSSEFSGLLHQIFSERIPGHDYRGYGILSGSADGGDVTSTFRTQKLESQAEPRPTWFVFPGMGSQWQGMGRELMGLDVFRNSIQNSRATLKNAGVDMDALLKRENTSIFENIRDAFNAIVVMQIALYDTMLSMGIRPAGYFGHSFGEIGCAYADGCLSAEEAILISDARGRAFETTRRQDSPGGMAAVGLSWSETIQRCPPDITPACHNGAQSVTISGGKSSISKFVQELQKDGIFAKEVNSCQIAAHSPFAQEASELYLKYMEDIYKGQGQRPRSRRWISTSIQEAKWDADLAQSASPEYFVNNFRNPVLFHEAVGKVPENAVVVEIAPQGLLQAILRSSLPSTCALLAPMQRKPEDKLMHFFTSVGDLYNTGINLKMAALYPPVQFPVSAQTPSISPLLKWNHERSWVVPIIENTEKYVDGMMNIDLNEGMYKYLEGHKLDERLVFPATGYLHFAWRSLAAALGPEVDELPITFENVSFERAIFLNYEKPTQLRFSLQSGTGAFEVLENEVTVTRGNISTPALLPPQIFNDSMMSHIDMKDNFLNTQDIYKELKIRGYNFSGDFRSIRKIDIEGKWAEVGWNGNWTTFIDSVMQAHCMNDNLCRTTAVPVRLQSLTINPKELFDYFRTSPTPDSVPVFNQIHIGSTVAPGIQVTRLQANVIQRKPQKGNLSISEYLFTPYFESPAKNIEGANFKNWEKTTLTAFIDLFLENFPRKKVEIYENFTKSANFCRPLISQILAAQPLFDTHLTTLSTEGEISNLKNQNETEENNSAFDNIIGKTSVEEMLPENAPADLVFLDDANSLRSLAAILKDNSWIILRDSEANLKKVRSSASSLEDSLQTIAQRISSNGDLTISLMKKVPPSASLNSIQINSISIDTPPSDWLPELKSLMAAEDSPTSRIYMYSQNNPLSGIVGLVKCLRREPGGDRIRCIFDQNGKLTLNFAKPGAELSEMIEKDLVMNVFQNGVCGSYRHIPLSAEVLTTPSKQVEHASVSTLTVGDLSSLRWIESPLKFSASTSISACSSSEISPPARGHAHAQENQTSLCQVSYASLNFRDIMLSTAKLPMDSKCSKNSFETQIGLEFSGRDEEGNRVMGMSSNTLATSVLGGEHAMLWKVPEAWSLEDAATVPVVYATAYYALCDRGRLEPGQSVLIHSGTGGVGQAAINIALSMNCRVFTSVGTADKRSYIKGQFPSLRDDHICNSRDTTFEQQVLEMTSGRGVDFILNSLAEDKLQASLNCLALGGTFSEIGKFDILKNNPLGMQHLGKNVDISGVDLIPLFMNKMPGKERLIKLVEAGIQNGVVQPLERTVFEKDAIEDAFRYMAAGKHMGKVLINVQGKEEDQDSTSTSSSKWSTKVMAIPKSYFDPRKTFVIIGGLGGFGLELANWLIERGAKHVVLMSRSGVTTGYQKMCLSKWAKLGAKVETSKVDLSHYNQAKDFIESYAKEGRSLGGIFNSGMVLRDALIENQTEEMFEAVAAPKIKITENLDQLTREHSPGLDYFVTFSSLSAGLGNAGQSNYGLANSTMEQICHARKEDGLHGVAIQWGVVGDVGFVAENMNEDQVFDGMNPQRISSCLEALDVVLQQSQGAHAHSTSTFSSMIVSDKLSGEKSSTKIGLTEAVARLCSIKTSLKDIDPDTLLSNLGLDSLSGTELQQLLEREYDCQLSSTKIQALTWGELKAIEQGSRADPSKKTGVNNPNIDISNTNLIPDPQAHKILVKLPGQSVKAGDNTGAPPLFIVHGGDGQSSSFTTLVGRIPRDLYAFQTGSKSFGKEADVPLLEDTANEYIKELKLVQPKGPYNIAGYSIGGCIAFEIVNQLENIHKDHVENLIILDSYCFFGMPTETSMLRPVTAMLDIVERIISLSDREKSMFFDNLHPTDLHENRKLLLAILDAHLESGKKDEALAAVLKSYYETMVALAVMACTHKLGRNFRKVGANVNLVKADSSLIANLSTSKDYDFEQFCENPITLTTIRGDHRSIFYPENVSEIAQVINRILESGAEDTSDEFKDALEF